MLSHGKSDVSAAQADGMIKSYERDVPFEGNKNLGKLIREVEEQEKFYHNNAIPPPYLKPPKATKHGADRGSVLAKMGQVFLLTSIAAVGDSGI